MPYCPKCNAEVPQDAPFCPKCAAHFGRGSLLKPIATPRESQAPATGESLPSAGSVVGSIILRLLLSAVISCVAAVGLFVLGVIGGGGSFTTLFGIWIFVTVACLVWTVTSVPDSARQAGKR